MLDQYIDELNKDLTVNSFNIKEIQLGLPSLKHKWAARLIRHKRELHQYQRNRAKLKKEIVDKLMTASVVKVAPIVAEKTAETTEALKQFDDNIEDTKLVIDFLEKTEKTLSSMTYDIKNMVEIMKLETS